MALTDKLAAIGNAIRSKTGKSGKLSLEQMVSEINGIVIPSFSTQTKSVDITSNGTTTISKDAAYDGMTSVDVNVNVPAPEPSYDTPTISVSSGGLITASANGKSNTQQLPAQAGKTVTPTQAEQTVVASGKYTTGAVKVSAIPSDYIVPSGSQTITENNTYDVSALASVIVNVAGSGGGLPSGFSAIAFGEYTVASDFTTTRQTVTHNMGVVPDLVLFYYDGGNIATTYTMLWSLRFTKMGYRASAYTLFNAYHGNSTTTVSVSNTNSTTVGVSNITATTFQIASHSTSYYWRGSKTYKWIAIKLS